MSHSPVFYPGPQDLDRCGDRDTKLASIFSRLGGYLSLRLNVVLLGFIGGERPGHLKRSFQYLFPLNKQTVLFVVFGSRTKLHHGFIDTYKSAFCAVLHHAKG
jgi:hypothetical protein